MRHSTRAGLLSCLAVGAGLLAGCSALGPSGSDADAVVTAFQNAIAASDGAGACELLNERARADVETQTGSDCAAGILTLDLGAPGEPRSTQVYGRAALVQNADDSVFLTVGGSSWLIRAAGCRPVEDAPFECTIEGS